MHFIEDSHGRFWNVAQIVFFKPLEFTNQRGEIPAYICETAEERFTISRSALEPFIGDRREIVSSPPGFSAWYWSLDPDDKLHAEPIPLGEIVAWRIEAFEYPPTPITDESGLVEGSDNIAVMRS